MRLRLCDAPGEECLDAGSLALSLLRNALDALCLRRRCTAAVLGTHEERVGPRDHGGWLDEVLPATGLEDTDVVSIHKNLDRLHRHARHGWNANAYLDLKLQVGPELDKDGTADRGPGQPRADRSEEGDRRACA